MALLPPERQEGAIVWEHKRERATKDGTGGAWWRMTQERETTHQAIDESSEQVGRALLHAQKSGDESTLELKDSKRKQWRGQRARSERGR